MEEMKEKLSVAKEEDTEEVKKWRGLSQSEMDQSWKNLAGRTEEGVLDKYKVEESNKEAFGCGSALGVEEGAQTQEIRIRKWREDCWARI